MLTAGIVAEYNPFHNGHKYLAEQTRTNGATHIIAVMSGAAVQRGDCAVYDKYFRAQTAVKNGIDLVLELPCPYSCSSGEIFASAAVKILSSLGQKAVQRLSFGCETDDVSLIKQAAEASEALKDSENVRRRLSEGKSYPLAVYETACEEYGYDAAEILRNPNGTLAAEYAKAAKKYAPWLELSAVKRKSAGHHDNIISDGCASAGKIRSMIHQNEDISALVPENAVSENVYFLANMQNEILYRLHCAEKSELLKLPDVSEETADRIIQAIKSAPDTPEDFLQLCKSKNITMARLRRIVMYLTLGIQKEDIQAVPYSRILAFNERGREILAGLSDTAIPIDTSLKRLESVSLHAKRVSLLERRATALQYFCGRKKTQFINEYSRKIGIM